jgi:hypothetical protein
MIPASSTPAPSSIQIGDEFFTFIVDCAAPKACTILLRGASKDVLNEVERNLHDAMGVARNIATDPRLVPGEWGYVLWWMWWDGVQMWRHGICPPLCSVPACSSSTSPDTAGTAGTACTACSASIPT